MFTDYRTKCGCSDKCKVKSDDTADDLNDSDAPNGQLDHPEPDQQYKWPCEERVKDVRVLVYTILIFFATKKINHWFVLPVLHSRKINATGLVIRFMALEKCPTD